MKFQPLAIAAVLFVFSLRLHAAPALTLEERMQKLEQENQRLREQMSGLTTQLNQERMTHSIVTGERIPLPSSYSSEGVGSAMAAEMAKWKAQQWLVGLNPNGGGFFLKSPDENFAFSLLGYARAQTIVEDGGNDNSFENLDFRLANARIDFIAEFYKRFSLLIETDLAAPGGAALVEANLTAKIFDEALQLRLGKFTVPFSTENFRSTRSLDTVKRYSALNALFGLPALDVQQGVMVLGVLPAGKKQVYATEGEGKDAAEKTFTPTLTYYLGVWNGKASASADGTRSDDNGSKEWEAKLVYQPWRHFTVGVGYDQDREEQQPLVLSSLAGTPFVGSNVRGLRRGVDADFFWEPNKFSLRGEGLYFDFRDVDVQLYGGFLQAAYWVSGDYSGGFQPLLRVEASHLSGQKINAAPGDSIYALTAGFNYFFNGNTRMQVNYVGEYFDGPGSFANLGDSVYRNSLLMDFEIKF